MTFIRVRLSIILLSSSESFYYITSCISTLLLFSAFFHSRLSLCPYMIMCYFYFYDCTKTYSIFLRFLLSILFHFVRAQYPSVKLAGEQEENRGLTQSEIKTLFLFFFSSLFLVGKRTCSLFDVHIYCIRVW